MATIISVPATAWSPDTLRTATLEVRADLDSALVYLDSLFVGHTPLQLEGLLPGPHRLTVVPPHPEEWSVQMVSDTVHLDPGTVSLHTCQLRYYVPVRSEPPGAEVYINDSLAGVTPLLVRPSSLHEDARLTLKLSGFETTSVPREARAGESALTVALKTGWQAVSDGPSPFLPDQPAWNSRNTGLYLSGGVSVLAGIGAAWLKIAADGKQEAFLLTGDPALASERKRLDTYAAISLAVAQAGLIVLSYLLITE